MLTLALADALCEPVSVEERVSEGVKEPQLVAVSVGVALALDESEEDTLPETLSEPEPEALGVVLLVAEAEPDAEAELEGEHGCVLSGAAHAGGGAWALGR